MSAGVIIGLLFVLIGRSYSNGHDIRGDWTNSERVICLLMCFGGIGAAGWFAGGWIA